MKKHWAGSMKEQGGERGGRMEGMRGWGEDGEEGFRTAYSRREEEKGMLVQDGKEAMSLL